MVTLSSDAPSPVVSTPSSSAAMTPTATVTMTANTLSWDTGTTALPRSLSRPAAVVGLDGRIYVFGGAANGTESATTYIYDPLANVWSTGAPMPTAREGARAATLPDGRIAVLGGGSLCGTSLCDHGVVYDRIEVYDPAANSWATLPHMLTPRYRPAVALLGGQLYAIGGSDGASVLAIAESLNLTTDTWSVAPSLPHPVQAAAATVDTLGHIDVAGGADNSGNVNTLFIFDGVSWRNGAALPEPTADMNGTTGPDGRFYVIGGYDRTWVATVQIYDPRQDSWSPGTSLPTPTCCAGTVLDGNHLYAIGGANGAPTAQIAIGSLSSPPSSSTTPSPEASVSVINTPVPSSTMGVTGTALVPAATMTPGGMTRPTTIPSVTATLTSTTTATPLVTSTATMNTPTVAATPTSTPGMTVTATIPQTRTGTAAPANAATSSTATSMPTLPTATATSLPSTAVPTSIDTLTWDTGTTALPRSLSRPAAVVGLDGRIYVFGGAAYGAESATTYIYDPLANVWSTGAPMPTAREGVRAATLPDGRIAVLGGGSLCGTSLCDHGVVYDRVEVYDPAANSWATLPHMLTPRYRPAVALLGGRLYAVGGSDGGSVVAGAEAFDLTTGVWSVAPSLPHPVQAAATIVDALGRMYVAGGADNSGNVNTLFIFDGASWRSGAALPEPTADMNGALGPDGQFYVIGGYDRTWVSTVQVYDTIRDRWTIGTSLPAPTCCTGAVMDGNRLYAIGGADAIGNPTAQVAIGHLSLYPVPTLEPLSSATATMVSASTSTTGPTQTVLPLHPTAIMAPATTPPGVAMTPTPTSGAALTSAPSPTVTVTTTPITTTAVPTVLATATEAAMKTAVTTMPHNVTITLSSPRVNVALPAYHTIVGAAPITISLSGFHPYQAIQVEL